MTDRKDKDIELTTSNPEQSEPLNPERRKILGGGAAVIGGIMAAGMVPEKAKAATMAQGTTFTVATSGECMATRPFSMHTEKSMMDMVRIFREADIGFTHLEMNLAETDELDWSARGSSGAAGYLVATPQIAKDLKWMGMNAISLAHNHSLDWGVAGLRATIRHCKAAGIAVAGTGDDLEEASAPVYIETDKGRVSMISVASGNSAFEWAGYAKGPIKGRPGVNMLRLLKVQEVDQDTAALLKQAGKNIGALDDEDMAAEEFNITPGAISGSNGFSGFTFRVSDQNNITTESHPGDVERNMRSIEEARRMSDFVMVSHHNSVSEEGRGETPPDFQYDFARKCIDAGADLYLGHGWHTWLGIEIYKNKPIIYGMGSFFWQSYAIQWKPADQYESHGFDINKLPTLNASSGILHPGGSNGDWGYAAINEFVYENNELREIRLHPIEMGFDYTGDAPVKYRVTGEGQPGGYQYQEGSPRMAYGDNGRWILERLQYLCSLRGTEVNIRGNMGVIRV